MTPANESSAVMLFRPSFDQILPLGRPYIGRLRSTFCPYYRYPQSLRAPTAGGALVSSGAGGSHRRSAPRCDGGRDTLQTDRYVGGSPISNFQFRRRLTPCPNSHPWATTAACDRNLSCSRPAPIGGVRMATESSTGKDTLSLGARKMKYETSRACS
jgi:hypothetical protein